MEPKVERQESKAKGGRRPEPEQAESDRFSKLPPERGPSRNDSSTVDKAMVKAMAKNQDSGAFQAARMAMGDNSSTGTSSRRVGTMESLWREVLPSPQPLPQQQRPQQQQESTPGAFRQRPGRRQSEMLREQESADFSFGVYESEHMNMNMLSTHNETQNNNGLVQAMPVSEEMMIGWLQLTDCMPVDKSSGETGVACDSTIASP